MWGKQKRARIHTAQKRTQGAAAIQGASPLDTTVTVSAAGFFAAGFFATPFLLAGLFRRVPPRAWRLRFRGPDSVVSAGSLMPQRSRTARKRNPCCVDQKLRLSRLRSETYQKAKHCVWRAQGHSSSRAWSSCRKNVKPPSSPPASASEGSDVRNCRARRKMAVLDAPLPAALVATSLPSLPLAFCGLRFWV